LKQVVVKMVDVAKIQADSDFFDKMLEMIPANVYYPPVQENDAMGKFAHNKKGKAPMQSHKENTKKGKKRKLAKFDPKNPNSALDVQRLNFQEKNEQQKAASGKKKGKGKNKNKKAKTLAASGTPSIGGGGGVLDALRAKLAAKLAGLESQRTSSKPIERQKRKKGKKEGKDAKDKTKGSDKKTAPAKAKKDKKAAASVETTDTTDSPAAGAAGEASKKKKKGRDKHKEKDAPFTHLMFGASRMTLRSGTPARTPRRVRRKPPRNSC
jgi:hypothetical protein